MWMGRVSLLREELSDCREIGVGGRELRPLVSLGGSFLRSERDQPPISKRKNEGRSSRRRRDPSLNEGGGRIMRSRPDET